MRFRVVDVMKCCSLAGIALMSAALPVKADDSFSVLDRLASAIGSVEEGIDSLWPPEDRPDGLRFRLGAGIGIVPDYTGSEDYRLRAIPLIEASYKNIWRLEGTRLTYTAYKTGGFETGPLLRYRFGRKQSDNPALAGLGNISNTLEVGGFARYTSNGLLISAEMSQALSSALGRTVRLTVGHGIYRDEKWLVGVAARARAISRKGMQTEFGITQAQSDRSGFGLPTFTASGGFSEVNAAVIGAYRLTDHARFVSIVSVGRLLGSAADSPLVVNDVGSRTQGVVGSALTFEF